MADSFSGVPRVFGELDVAIGDLRVMRGGGIRFRVDGALGDPAELPRLAEAQGAERVRLVLLSLGPQPLPIPGTEEAGEATWSARVAAGLRLLEALEESAIAHRRNGEVSWEPSADGSPPPFPPGTPLGETDEQTRARVTELAAADPEGAAVAAAEGVRRGRRRRRGQAVPAQAEVE